MHNKKIKDPCLSHEVPQKQYNTILIKVLCWSVLVCKGEKKNKTSIC